ncbi:MAG: MBL fold metallo-hydrolase [Planctomycetes bacterium]|nr:MBL fold metallo-hydrolase [Planctomycetota bacterium]
MHLGTIDLGGIRVDVIDGGGLWMDGGGIFSVVPKVLWERVCPADDRNRVKLWFISLLVRTDEATVVIEAGSAVHKPPKVAAYHEADQSTLAETLGDVGVAPEDVDFFIPTHLHFDHVGAASDPAVGPLFPNAEYVIQQVEWEQANAPEGWSKNAYIPGDIEGLHSARLGLVDGDKEITPGIKVIMSGGHTVGHQMVEVGTQAKDRLVYTGDIVPMSYHIRPRWISAFDIAPAQTYAVKVGLLERAAAEGSFLVPGHGGPRPVCRVAVNADGKFTAESVPGILPPA